MINKLKNVSFILFITLFVLFVQPSTATTITIEADKQNFQVENNTAYFNGNVKVAYGNITIASPKAVLNSNVKGEPEKATFSEGASVIKADKESSDKLTADSVTLMLASNQLIAEGNTYSEIKQNTPAAITVRANRQELNNVSNEIKASGGVTINYKGMKISGEQAVLITSASGKPYKATITGNARIVRDTSTISAGSISIELSTHNLTASGGVNTVTTLKGAGKVSMSSSYQQYDKGSNTIIGSGKVKVVYQDYVATGPKATLFTSSDNSLQKIIFSGRAQIRDVAREVSANTISVSFNPKNFTAEGNVKTRFIKKDFPKSGSLAVPDATSESPKTKIDEKTPSSNDNTPPSNDVF